MKGDFLKKLFFYILIGVLGVVVDTLTLNIFYNFIFNGVFQFGHDTLEATMSAILGGVAGFTNNFLLNEYFVYKKQGSKKVVFTRFFKYVVTIIFGTFILGKLLVFNLFYTHFGLGLTTSNLIAIAFGTLINYPINYFWTWGDFSFKKHLGRKKEL